MNAMLYDVVQHGTARGAMLPVHEAAGKTGTSSEFRDAWFIGFTSDIVTGVWVGNDDFTPMRRVTGGNLPAQIWKGYMTVAVKGTPATPLPKELPQPDTMTYASLGNDSWSQPQQDQNNGFVIEVPSFLRDLFGSTDDNDRERREARQRERDQERERERARARNRYEDRARDPFAGQRALAPAPRDLEAERRGLGQGEQAWQDPYGQQQPTNSFDRSDPYGDRSVVTGSLPPPPPPPPMNRGFGPGSMPPVDRGFAPPPPPTGRAFGPGPMPPVDRFVPPPPANRDDAYANRNAPYDEMRQMPPPPPPPRVASRPPFDPMDPPMDTPESDVYERDLDPGYYEDEAPPLPPPPPDPWFGWMR
jgi:penicillin-binding protein 1A